MHIQVDNGFRLYNQFSVFVYSQLQNLFPDSFLSDITDWDNYLKIDPPAANLPFKTPAEFVLGADYQALIITSRLPRPSKFVEQTMSFCKAFCGVLLNHEVIKSDLLRGLSSFDHAVLLDGPEENYVSAVESLTSYFVSCGWMTASNKVKAVSQYRSFAIKLRAESGIIRSDWVQFLISHYEMQSRPELLQLFRNACLCLPPVVIEPPKFHVSIPGLESDDHSFRSVVRSLQLSYVTVPNVSSLCRSPKTISRVFRLLGRGPSLIRDRKLSVWKFLKGSEVRRSAVFGKLEISYKKSVLRGEGLPLFLDMTSPSESRTPSSSGSPVTGPSLGRVSVTVSRCSEEGVERSAAKSKSKASKEKKN